MGWTGESESKSHTGEGLRRDGWQAAVQESRWTCGPMVYWIAQSPCKREMPGSIPSQGSYLRQISLH